MKKITLLLMFVWSVPMMVSGQSTDDFKVITYNIWNGFDWGKDTLRRKDLQEWVGSQKPDVVALQELCAYTDEKLQEDAAAWGHPYSVLLKTTGYSVGLTSKHPIELKEKMLGNLHHGALHVQTKGIDFLVVHLHPGSIERRREEVKILQVKLAEIASSTDKFMVLGDFNAQSPYDEHLYEPNGDLVKRMWEGNKEKGLAGNMLGEGELDFSVMSAFLSFPLHDVTREFAAGILERGSFPGMILSRESGESKAQMMGRLVRLDYIMVSESLYPTCRTAKVHNGKDNWYLSDHYPVSASFAVD
ncbi:hypothetical protein GCM10028791_18440 [Echinicola sediminis]